VNNGSTDRTGEIVEDYARLDPRIVPIHHNPIRGVGAAITSGYKRAVEDGMDNNNQMDPGYDDANKGLRLLQQPPGLAEHLRDAGKLRAGNVMMRDFTERMVMS